MRATSSPRISVPDAADGCRGDPERTGEVANGVEMVDEHFHDEEAVEPREERLALDREGPAGRTAGDEPRAAHGHLELPHGAGAALGQPGGCLAVLRSEAPVFVHHEAHPVADVRDQPLGFGQIRGHRFLAEDVDPAFGGHACLRGVGLGRGGDVEHVRPLPVEHLGHIRVGGANPELRRTGTGVLDVPGAERDDLDLRQLPPREQVVPRHHPGAGDGDSEAGLAGHTAPLSNPNSVAGVSHRMARRSRASGTQRASSASVEP